MTSLSSLFLIKGNEKSRDAYCLALFEKAWKKAEQIRRIPGAKEINEHLIFMLTDVIKSEDLRNITRLKEAIGKWEFTKGLQADQRRQLSIIQLILLTEILDSQYQELLQAVRVRELAACCGEFIRKREKQLSGVFTVPLAAIKPDQIANDQLKLEIQQYQAVLSMQSALHTEQAEDTQKISLFGRIFNTCKSTLETSADSLCMQFIKKILELLPTTLTSHFGFFRTETQQLVSNVESLADEEACQTYSISVHNP